ncbi:MAG: histidine phosphatase family protein [Clostridia bacterium]
MIYLLRHGLDNENYIGGWSDIDLSNEGVKQVEEVCKYIKDNSLIIHKIYTSDIKRAITTSKIIKSNALSDVLIEPTKILRELNKGALNGLDKKKALILYSQYFPLPNLTTKYPNGESMQLFYLRIKKNLDTILKEDNSLIVTHRGVINMIYYILNEIALDMNNERFLVEHASLHEYNPLTKSIKKIV